MYTSRYFAIFLLACCVSPHSADRQSPIAVEEVRGDCVHLRKLCCNANHPCCCSRVVCTHMDCMQYIFPPDKSPETAFFKFTGLEPGAPCCGPKCSLNQCLELIKLQLIAIQDPLRTQRDNLEESPDEVDCCGEGCSNRGCFSDILDNLIQLQSPINNTQNTHKSGIAKEDV
jgi:hypothetical protein